MTTETPRKKGAGEQVRTVDIQLGNVTPAPAAIGKTPESHGSHRPVETPIDRVVPLRLALFLAYPDGLGRDHEADHREADGSVTNPPTCGGYRTRKHSGVHSAVEGRCS